MKNRIPFAPLEGLVVAAHTPFDADGGLNLAAVEAQAAHYARHELKTVFIAGSTGESHSLAADERERLAARWLELAPAHGLRVIVHVGSNCIGDAKRLAAHAAAHRAVAVAALAPSYFKPRSVDALVDVCAAIAGAAPDLPFYFYDIPSLTGVSFPVSVFLERAAARVPSLAGVKYTNSDLMEYQLCLRHAGGAFDLPWGNDEYLLAALALGARGAVGSTYNFAAPLYQRLLRHFAAGDLPAAREEQFRSVQLVRALAARGYMGSAKAVMGMLGVPVGPARLPNGNLTPEQTAALRTELETMGFFDWIKA